MIMRKMIIILLCVMFIAGCFPRSMNKYVSQELQPATLRYSFNTQPPNFKQINNCKNSDVTINVLNAEKKNFDITIARGWYLNSQELSDMTVEYLKDAYRQCRVITRADSNKTIEISFQSIEGYISFNSGTTLKINVNIPEKNTTIPFVITQSAIDLHKAVVYAIHDISWQIVNDPTIQDYILCK